MPMRGFACAYGQGDVTFKQCLSHSQTDPPECGFTYPILAGMVSNLRGEMAEVTVTQILNCLRKPALERRHDVYLEPKQLYYAFRGQMFHQIAAGVDLAECVVEQRFRRRIAGIMLSGQPDLISPRLKKLWDFKTTRRIPKDKTPYAQHGLQVNIYRWLALTQYEIEHLEIVYLDMSDVLRVPVEVIPTKQVLSWLWPRVKKLRAALDGGRLPPRVGPDGLWQCNGYCFFTACCWPKGVPTPAELRRKEEARRKAVLKALGRAA